MDVKWNHRLAELIDDWGYYFKVHSWRYSILTILKELVQLPYRHMHYLIYSRSLAEPLLEVHPDVSIVIRCFVLQDIPEVAKINHPSEAKLCAQHLAEDHVGVSALYDGHLVGYAWAYTQTTPNIDSFEFYLEPFDFLCNDAFTSPKFRGRSIQPSFLLTHFRIFREMGYQRAMCYIDRQNRSSIRVWEKMEGFV